MHDATKEVVPGPVRPRGGKAIKHLSLPRTDNSQPARLLYV